MNFVWERQHEISDFRQISPQPRSALGRAGLTSTRERGAAKTGRRFSDPPSMGARMLNAKYGNAEGVR
jgi:hypothetical protein